MKKVVVLEIDEPYEGILDFALFSEEVAEKWKKHFEGEQYLFAEETDIIDVEPPELLSCYYNMSLNTYEIHSADFLSTVKYLTQNNTEFTYAGGSVYGFAPVNTPLIEIKKAMLEVAKAHFDEFYRDYELRWRKNQNYKPCEYEWLKGEFNETT